MTVLVDSDILIEVSRAKNAGIVAEWLELSESGAAILYSPVSVAELWAGARPNEYDALKISKVCVGYISRSFLRYSGFSSSLLPANTTKSIRSCGGIGGKVEAITGSASDMAERSAGR